MADITNGGLPVRTDSDADFKVQVKHVDFTTATQGQSVDTDGNAHIEVHGNKPTTGADVVLRLGELGQITPDGVYDAANNTKPGNVGQIIAVRNATPGDVQQTLRRTGIQVATVISADVALHDSAGNDITRSNPLFVVPVDDPGTPVCDYATASAIVHNASTNHDYAIVSPNILDLHAVEASASGRQKVVITYTLDGSTFITLGTQFNSTAQPNSRFETQSSNIKIVGSATTKVRVTQTNIDTTSLGMDLYSSIIGVLHT